MAHKLSILDHFIREHKQFAFDYMREPTATKKRYEEIQEKKNKKESELNWNEIINYLFIYSKKYVSYLLFYFVFENLFYLI